MKALVLVSNDIATDRRVERSCSALMECGYDVLLAGRVLPESMPVDDRPYEVRRLKLLFRKQVWFYAELNIRFFLLAMAEKYDLIFANDLDTLPAAWLSATIRRKKLIYDSHEYFTGVPELTHNKLGKFVWSSFERIILPRLKYAVTVNNSIAKLYKDRYGVDMAVVRNMPVDKSEWPVSSKRSLQLPDDKFIMILQGSGINIDRGGEEIVSAMQYIDAVLLIVGSGDAIPILTQMAREMNLTDKVRFIPKQTSQKLHEYTANADLGLSLDKNTNLNYYYSLPNKLFDYIQAGTPVLASSFPEIVRIVEEYHVGMLLESHDCEHIAAVVNEFKNNAHERTVLKSNCRIAAAELCWNKEKLKLFALIKKCK
jgi:glycosyltransferase involved in cell wall biosynthesis